MPCTHIKCCLHASGQGQEAVLTSLTEHKGVQRRAELQHRGEGHWLHLWGWPQLQVRTSEMACKVAGPQPQLQLHTIRKSCDPGSAWMLLSTVHCAAKFCRPHLLGVSLLHLQRSMLPLHSRLAALQLCGQVSNLPPELRHQAVIPTLALRQQLRLHAQIQSKMQESAKQEADAWRTVLLSIVLLGRLYWGSCARSLVQSSMPHWRCSICQAAHERGRLPPHTPTGHVPEVRGTSHLQLRVVPCQVLQPVRVRAPVAARGGAPAAEGIVVLHLEGQRRVGLHRQSAAAVVWGLRQGVQAPPVHRKSLCNKFGG